MNENAIQGAAAELQAETTPTGELTAPTQETTATPEYATLEQLNAMREELSRRIQSVTAKQENRLRERIEERIDALAKAGIQATPEQVSALITAEEAEAQTAEPERQTSGSPATTGPNPLRGWIEKRKGNPDDPAWNIVAEIVMENGVDLEPDDPEVRAFFYDADGKPLSLNRSGFVQAWTRAVEAKKIRTQSAPEPESGEGQEQLAEDEEANPAAVPGIGTIGHTNRIRPANLDENELLSRAFSNRRK